MKSNYEERKANRLEAYQNLAAKNAQISNAQFERSHKLADVIPFGQPILVGHHSERGHRAHIKKIHNAMNASVEADKKSEYYRNKVENLLNGTAISSDDPNAIEKLQEKLIKLQELQEIYKAVNKIIKNAKLAPAEKISKIMDLGLSESRATKLMQPDFCNRLGFPSYVLTNNNGNMANVKKRIAHLESLAKIQTTTEEINGVELKISAEDNRVQIFFGHKPDEATRSELKSSGFHWTPSIEAWQRQISNWAIYQAREILKKYKS